MTTYITAGPRGAEAQPETGLVAPCPPGPAATHQQEPGLTGLLLRASADQQPSHPPCTPVDKKHGRNAGLL